MAPRTTLRDHPPKVSDHSPGEAGMTVNFTKKVEMEIVSTKEV